MLDDECKLPKASDDKFAARLYKSLETHGRFTATTAQKRDMQFCIRHYAGPVVYNAASFIEKNKDELPKEAAALLCSSRLPFLSHIYTAAAATTAAAAAEEAGGKKGAGGSKAAHSVGAQFKEQLSLLMKSIQVTTPHYIRCLKPNDQNVSDKFDRVRTTEQLRYGGVLEAVRVARSGFPVRLVHAEFFARYRVIANPFCGVRIPLKLDDSAPNGSATSSNRAQDLCKMLLRAILDDKTPADAGNARAVKAWAQVCGAGGSGAVAQESVQLGLTKVFLRKTAHDTLEGRRTRRLKQATLTIQCKFRSHQQRKWYVAVVRAVPKLQKVVRGFVARRKVYRLRRTRAAVLLQSFVRAAFARRRYARFRGAAVRLQSGFRGRRGRAAARVFRQMRNALRVQSALRCGVARIRYLKLRRAVVALQCCVRRRRARKVLKARRAAAKDVGKLQTSNEALKKEIEELRIRAAEEARKAQKEAEERASVASAEEIVRLREELEALKATLDVERTGRTADRSAAAAEVAQLQSERQAEAAARSSLEKEVASLRQAETSLTGRLQEAAQREAAAEEELRSLRAAQSAVPAPSPVAAEHERAGDPPAAAGAGAGATELSLLPPPPSATSAPSSPKVTKPGPSAAASSGSPAVSSAVIATFEKNLASLRSKLRQGLKAQLWEEGPNVHIQNFECVLQLDKTFEVITFTATATRSAFALFATQKVEVAPVKIANIVDCHPGAASLHDQGFSSMFGVGASHSNSAAEMMTLIVKVDAKKDFEEPPRVIALRLPQREDRNHLMTALRTMISDLHVNTPTMRLLVEGAKKGVVVPTTADKQPQVPRRSSVSTVSPSGGGAAGVEHDLTNYESATDMKKQLLLERSNYERLMLQLFALTNDLNEREETITALKKRVATLEQTLAANEKMHEQDALIRLQLGKRLEQVLMDKEEALEELDMVQTKLESIRSAMQLVDFSKASALAETITKSPTRSSSTRG
jgi:myosin heavy subunit